MSQRYQTGHIRYKHSKLRDKLSVQFQDRFGKKFINAINLKQFFTQTILGKYKTRKKDNNKIQLKLKKQHIINSNNQTSINKEQSVNQIDEQQIIQTSKNTNNIDHSQLIDWLNQVLQLDYYYFKSLPNNKHIDRNKRFKTICSQQFFKQLYPQVRCLILIESQTKNNNDNNKFIIEQKQQQQQTFNNGQLIIFIERQKKHSVKEVVKYLQTFNVENVIYPLDDYVGLIGLKRDGVSLMEVCHILEKLIVLLNDQIVQMAKQTRLLVKYMRIYAPDSKKQRYPNYQGKLGLQMKLQGMFQSLPQFYFNLSSLFKHHPITIGKVQNIQFSKDMKNTQTQYQKQGIYLFFGSYKSVGIINLKKSFTDWIQFKRSLRKGLYIISQAKGFTRQQIEILIKQHRDVEIFVNNQQFSTFVHYEFKPIDDKSFFIKCEKQNVDKFVKRAFDYLNKNQRVQIKRQQFTTQFELFYFNKLIKSHIQQQYPTISFFVKKGALYSRSRKQDFQDLKIQLVNQKRKFLKKIVRLPCVRQMKMSHLYEIVEDQFQTQKYCNQINAKTIHYVFNQSINIYFRPLSSLSHCHQLLITIIDQYYDQFQFFIQKFKQNALSLDKYQKYISGQIQSKSIDRMILYSMNKSKFIGQMLVWFIDQDQRNNVDIRKLRWDMTDFVEKNKTNNILQFIIPQNMWKNYKYFDTFFSELFKQITKHQGSIKTKTINVFYETDLSSTSYNKLLQTLKKVFQMGNNNDYFELKSQMRLTESQIQRVILTQGWCVSYWDNESQKNENLSVLNSFVLAYEKSRRKDEFKVPLFLKPKQSIINNNNGREYLMSLKEDIYYKLQQYNLQISKHQTINNPILSKFSNIIKTYFKFLQYIVVYMNQNQTQMQSKKMYFWINSTSSSSNTQKTITGQQKIKRFQINQQQKLIPKKNSQVDIYVKKVDFIPKFIIQTHQDFLQQVKKKLFYQNNNQ